MSTRPPETFARPDRVEEEGSAKLQVKVGGMHCSLCTESIHKGLSRLDGVEDAQVSIAHEEALIRYDPGRISDPELRETLVEARELAGRSYRLTLTNVGLALTFNGVGVLAAISGLVAPVWAMIAMAASVSLVLLNSFTGKLLHNSDKAGVQKA